MAFDKEAIYDDEIHPLMAKIIEICLRERIPMAATFAIKDDGEDGPLLCSTVIDGEDVDPETPGLEVIKRVREAILQKPLFMAVRIQSRGK